MNKKLSEDLKYWRSERPDEWTMDRFIKSAEKLEYELSNMENMHNMRMKFNEFVKTNKNIPQEFVNIINKNFWDLL